MKQLRLRMFNQKMKRMTKTSVPIYKYIPALLLLVVLGCRLPQPLATPDLQPMPAAFDTAADTIGIGSKPWQQFFKDPQLRALIDTALAHNYALMAANERVKMSAAVLLAARNAWLPSLDISAAAGVDKYGKYTLNGVGNFDTNKSPNIDNDQRIPESPTPDLFLGLRSSWEIDLWGKLRQRKQAAQARYLASAEGRRLVSTLLVSAVAAHYYELTALDSELVIIQKNIHLQEAALSTVQIQQSAGKATLLATQQFEAQLLDTRSLEFATRQRMLAVESELNYLLGRYPQPIARTSQLPLDALAAAWQPGVPTALLTNRPDIQQAELELAAAKADVRAARAAFLPSLNITPYAGYNAFKANPAVQSKTAAGAISHQ